MTLLIAFLLKVFARVTGKAMTFDAPPPAVGTVGALQATAVRLPDGSYGVPGSSFAGYGAGTFPPSGAFGHLPSASPPGNGHIGRAELDEASLRAAVEMYLPADPGRPRRGDRELDRRGHERAGDRGR